MLRTDRIQIDYGLTFATPFHCGTGLRTGLIDRTVVRDGGGYLYVPGSTIKGIVREHCEQLAYLYEEDQALRSRLNNPHNEKNALWELGRPATMITRIFGSQSHPGLLCFDDAQQSETTKLQYAETAADEQAENSEANLDTKKYQNLQTDIYTQVRLDRPTRTSVHGALYTSEFGVKNFTLQGSITGWLNCIPLDGVDNGPTYSLLLLLAGLRIIDRIGGNKSSGKGQCELTFTRFLLNGHPYTDHWQHWLDHLEALSTYSIHALLQEEEE